MWQCGTAPCCLPLLPPPAPTALAAAAAVVRARPRAAKVLRATHHQGACHRRCAGDASRLREAGSPRQGTTRASQLIVGCTCPSGLGGRIQSRRRAAALEMGQKKGPFPENGPKERAISKEWTQRKGHFFQMGRVCKHLDGAPWQVRAHAACVCRSTARSRAPSGRGSLGRPDLDFQGVGTCIHRRRQAAGEPSLPVWCVAHRVTYRRNADIENVDLVTAPRRIRVKTRKQTALESYRPFPM